MEVGPACIGGKTGSYSVWQPTDTRTLGTTGGTGSAGGGWLGDLRTGGGDPGLGVRGSRGRAGEGGAWIMWGEAASLT